MHQTSNGLILLQNCETLTSKMPQPSFDENFRGNTVVIFIKFDILLVVNIYSQILLGINRVN